MDRKDEKRSQDEKPGGHHLPPKATENPMDDTDRNSDKIITIEPSQQIPAVE